MHEVVTLFAAEFAAAICAGVPVAVLVQPSEYIWLPVDESYVYLKQWRPVAVEVDGIALKFSSQA